MFEDFIGVAAIFITIGFACSMSAMHMRKREAMMRLRLVGCVCFVIYFYLKDAMAGAFGATISTIGSVVQVITPAHMLEKTLYLRTGVALLLAGVGIYAFAGTSGVLPMLAVIIGRLSEVQSCVQRIRFGLLLGQCFWLAYSIELMILPFIMTETCLIICNLWASWKHHREEKQKALAASA